MATAKAKRQRVRRIHGDEAGGRVPESVMAGYSGTPLPKKLGIKEGGARAKVDLMIWFARSLAEVEREIVGKASASWTGRLWIAWPKKASGVPTDLREPHVRRLGLANGLVDYKVCAIDATWSGLKFARRTAARPKADV